MNPRFGGGNTGFNSDPASNAASDVEPESSQAAYPDSIETSWSEDAVAMLARYLQTSTDLIGIRIPAAQNYTSETGRCLATERSVDQRYFPHGDILVVVELCAGPMALALQIASLALKLHNKEVQNRALQSLV